MSIQLLSCWNLFLRGAESFFNSVFFIATVGSLAGAFGGAWGAQRIAERSKDRAELLKELRNTNAAIVVAFSICNTLISAKKQHVKSLKENFEKARSDLIESQTRGGIFAFQADFRTLPEIDLPLAILQAQIFEKLSLEGRGLMLMTTLVQSVGGLNAAILRRNQLIELYKRNSLPRPVLPSLYFGLAQNDGHIDQEYPDLISAIYTQNDDSIFFSQLLCNDLIEHGEKIFGSYEKQFGNGAPRISKPDFSKAEKAELMPPTGNYTDWLNMFVKHPPNDRRTH
ncbi:MAG: hypothetical protein WAU63_02125 [Methylovirgula sp.]